MNDRLETRYRLTGVLPLLFFAVQTVHYWRFGGIGNLLWMCNAGNVLLGIGLLIGHREMIRAAAIWTIPGLGIWIKYVLLADGFYFSTTLAHLGGLAVGMFALHRVRMDRIAWLYAFGWYFLTQIAARVLAPSDLNVNVADHIQTGWEPTFSSYWKFWLVMSLAVAAVLWVIGLALSLIWPAKVTEPRAVASESYTQA